MFNWFVNPNNTDYKLIHSYAMNDTIMGSKILETHYEDIMRGLLKDPLRAGKYPDYVSSLVRIYLNNH